MPLCRPFALLIATIAAFAMNGCGPSLKSVEGVVTLDGNPVEGALVTFVSEDGKNAYTGTSDAQGKFELSLGNKKGVPAGTYKVLVTKQAALGTGPITPGSPEYFKQVEKDQKANAKAGAAKGPKMPGMPMMPGGAGAPMSAPPIKTELPVIYANAASTPLTVKIPSDSDPVKIELKSRP